MSAKCERTLYQNMSLYILYVSA